jgi:hypothetical protein
MGRRSPREKATWKEWNTILDRVGRARSSRLRWVVERVQESRRGMTAGQHEDLRRELALFASDGGGTWDETGLDVPRAEEVSEILAALEGIIAGAVKRERVSIARRVGELFLVWSESEERFRFWDDDDDDSWELQAKHALARLLVDCGNLLKECPAPSPRAGEGTTCETWFVANRPRQVYCSATCQSRAATRAFRTRTRSRRRRPPRPSKTIRKRRRIPVA